MKIKLSELKKIIREESLNESFSPMKSIVPQQKSKASLLQETLEDLIKKTAAADESLTAFLALLDDEVGLGTTKSEWSKSFTKIKNDLTDLTDEMKKKSVSS
tara:strand:+ start:328 stop:633 length:306 start_codon:yes stop_codon:yes gene_type:complete